MNKSVIVTAAQCPNCGDTIYSRASCDYRECSCGDTAIDGGRDYTRLTAIKINEVKLMAIPLIGITEQMLYNDWNLATDQYGLMKEEKRRHE